MTGIRKIAVLLGNTAYWQKIKNLFGASIIAYYPLWEASGTVARDISGNGYDATYQNASLSSLVGSSGKNIPLFPEGSNARLNLFSDVIKTKVPYSEGGVSFFYKPENVSIYSDNTERYLLMFRANNWVDNLRIYKNTSNVLYLSLAGNSIEDSASMGLWEIATASGWQNITLTWSKTNDRLSFYLNGKLKGIDTFPEDWVTTTATLMSVMSFDASNKFFPGYLDSLLIIYRVITEVEARKIVDYSKIKYKRITFLGDSITAGNSWVTPFVCGYKNGSNVKENRATSGAGIIANMDAQTVAAASDDADIIIIELGTNDDNAGNMTTLQAEYEENIAELKASNPLATIYAMNVLPRWTDVGGGTVIDKSNIRTAIATACTAQGITCWDTYTIPWIDAADTSDGTHPTTAGHAKIAAEVLARLP